MSLFGLIPFVFGNLFAQSASSLAVDVGGLSIKQPQHNEASAAAVTISARYARTFAAISGSALLVRASDKSNATQATIGAELMLPSLRAFRVDVSGSATTFGAFAADNGRSRNVYVRPQFMREHFGVFGTVGTSTAQRDSARFHSLVWDAGAWAQRGRLAGAVAVRRSFTNDYLLMEASNFFLFREARHYSVQDVEGTMSARFSRFELQASGAWRDGFDATDGHSGLLTGAVTTRVTSRLALILSGGKQLADALTGVPQATVLSASMRVSFSGADSRSALIVRTDSSWRPRTAAPFATQIERHAGGGATVTVRVDAPSDARVEISGTFNNWVAAALPRSDNGFEYVIELPAGTHRVAVRVNGGEWKAPLGLARIKDDLGGESGLIVVP